jgi:hypothetical protein
MLSEVFAGYFEEVMKKTRGSGLEVLYLQYVDYLTYELSVPLLAYISLKRFESKFKRSSSLFRGLANLRVHQMRTLAVQGQREKMRSSFVTDSEKEHYTLGELRRTERLVEKLLP